jgi:hypothetical protein
MPLWIREDYINQTKGYRFGDSGWHEAHDDSLGKLFKALQKEFGKCVSKVYVDKADGPPMQTGWVFEKTMEYDDAHRLPKGKDRTYIREVWVTVSTFEPKKTYRYDPQPKSPWEKAA